MHHFSPKWNNNFDKYDFLIQIIFSCIIGIIYFYTNNIFICIVAHVTYNSPTIICNMKNIYYNLKLNGEDFYE